MCGTHSITIGLKESRIRAAAIWLGIMEPFAEMNIPHPVEAIGGILVKMEEMMILLSMILKALWSLEVKIWRCGAI